VTLSSPVVTNISDEPGASLKMKAEDSSNTMATIYHTTWHHISEDNDLNNALVLLELSDLQSECSSQDLIPFNSSQINTPSAILVSFSLLY
jgi:hypothetical protein